MRRQRIVAISSALMLATLWVPARLSTVARAAPAAGDPVVVAAGDIASCRSPGDQATAALVQGTPDATVLPLGDEAYPNGSQADFANCYAPTWGTGDILRRSKPVAGNHEYVQPGASPYYRFFGAAAGDPAKGYYSYEVGTWHLIALNSTCSAVGGCGSGSPQERWVKADLAAHPAACVLAYWHHPRYFTPAVEPGVSNVGTSDTKMSAIWRDLQGAGAAIVLSGHRHVYERFARQDAAGKLDSTGIRQLIAGTGGGPHEAFVGPVAPNSEVRKDGTYGVLQLTLHSDGYDWRFNPTAGDSFTDSGSDTCRPGGTSTTPTTAAKKKKKVKKPKP